MEKIRDGMKQMFINNIGKNIKFKYKMDIHFIFSLGYRCTTDDFLKKYNIRKFSSPFSYMVVDLNTSINFIKNSFENFLNVNHIDNISLKKYKWKNKIWNHELFFNKNIILNDENIINYDSMCVWNHHDLNNSTIYETIKKRCERMMYYLNNHSNNILLFYIDKLRKPISNNLEYIDFDNINELLKKYNTHLLYLLPIENYLNIDIIKKENLNIIIYPSNNNLNSNDINDKNIPWDKIYLAIISIYNLNLKSI
jgi:hypothetical protein